MLGWLAGLRSEWRFGRATKMHRTGRLEEAYQLYSANRAVLGRSESFAVTSVSLRLMNLVQLANVAVQLGHHDVARDALTEWLSFRDAACQREPRLAAVPELNKWERWVRERIDEFSR